MIPSPDDFTAGPADARTHRLIPSRFPPVAAFEDVARPEDLDALFELEGWTNDRIAGPRLRQIDPSERVWGRPNASVVMAAFLHGSPTGLRFSGPELGAWYASDDVTTCVLEVATALRREIALSALTRKVETYRDYTAALGGEYADVRGHAPFHDPSPGSYPVPQAFGRAVRDLGPGGALCGIRYESVRRPGHDNWVCFRPPAVGDVVQAGHLEIDVPPEGKIAVRRLG